MQILTPLPYRLATCNSHIIDKIYCLPYRYPLLFRTIHICSKDHKKQTHSVGQSAETSYTNAVSTQE